jgi:hypothetical protein
LGWDGLGQAWMRAATFVVVLAIHVVFFFVFALHRSPDRQDVTEVAPAGTLMLLQEAKPVELAAEPPVTARARRRAAPKVPAAVSSAPEPESESLSMTPTPVPDWRSEAQIAANDVIEAEARKRERPSPLAPHDFSRVRPGSTDDIKPQFAWNRARTQRVEELPTGGLLIHINDRCSITLVFILPFLGCKLGKL